MNELAYHKYQLSAKWAEKLKNLILELYEGTNLNTAYLKAIKDGVITNKEAALLREYYDVNAR